MSEQAKNEKHIAMLTIKQVMDRIRLSRSTIYDKVNPKSPRFDPTFPKPYKLGDSAVRWKESEVEAWLASRTIIDPAQSSIESHLLPTNHSKEKIDDNERDRIESSSVRIKRKDKPAEKIAPVVNATEGQIAGQSYSENNRIQLVDLAEKRIATIRRLLEENARNGTLVRYSELMAATMLSPVNQNDWQALDKMITSISKSSHLENNVLLDAHVREHGGSDGVPRDAFFENAQSLGYKCDDRKVFVKTQLLALFAHYNDLKYKTATNLTWVQIRGKVFLTCPN